MAPKTLLGWFFGPGGPNVATPAAPKRCRHGAEPNKRASAVTPAPARQDPIGGVGSPRHLQPDDKGPLASDGS
jgi:hypothetical protein